MIIVPVGTKGMVDQGIIKGAHCFGNEKKQQDLKQKRRYLPAEKYPYLSLHFYDTYIYYIIPRIY